MRSGVCVCDVYVVSYRKSKYRDITMCAVLYFQVISICGHNYGECDGDGDATLRYAALCDATVRDSVQRASVCGRASLHFRKLC